MTLQDDEEEASILKLSMRALREYYGLNPGKHAESARGLGYQLGIGLAKILPSSPSADLDAVVKDLALYWSRNAIGEMSWMDRGNLLLAINNCSDCLGKSYGAGYTLCPFKEGLLAAFLGVKLGKPFRVREIECCGTQAANCLFKIEMA